MAINSPDVMAYWAATSHLYHRSKAITSVRTYRTSWSITRSFPCPSGSHQPSSNRLAPPERPTTSNLAPYHQVWPATDQPRPQLGVASHTRSFQMAFSCGDGYAHRWACHLMMMMNGILRSVRPHWQISYHSSWPRQRDFLPSNWPVCYKCRKKNISTMFKISKTSSFRVMHFSLPKTFLSGISVYQKHFYLRDSWPQQIVTGCLHAPQKYSYLLTYLLIIYRTDRQCNVVKR